MTKHDRPVVLDGTLLLVLMADRNIRAREREKNMLVLVIIVATTILAVMAFASFITPGVPPGEPTIGRNQ